MNKKCCFVGHSHEYYTDDIYNRLTIYIAKLFIEEKISEFLVGNYGRFNKLAAKAVRNVKRYYPKVKLNLVIPYPIPEINCDENYYLENYYDNIIVADIPLNLPEEEAIIKCNQYMISYSDILVCYMKHLRSKTATAVEYAKNKKDIQIVNMAY